jgi:hypothetical protein
MSKPIIAITFPNHWSIKNLIHSGAVAQIQEFADIQGLVEPNRIPDLTALVAELGLAPIEWIPITVAPESKQVKRYRHMQKSLLFEKHQLSTEQIVQRSGRRRRSIGQRIGTTVIKGLAQVEDSINLLVKLSRQRFEATPSIPWIKGKTPHVFFATNPVDFREDGLVKAAMEAGIPVVSMVPSWDNLTTKGVLFTKFEKLFVWNQDMQEEVLTLYPYYRKSEVPVIGIPRFQVFGENLPEQFQRENLLTSLGLDPNLKTILFANTATSSFPDQPTVAKHIAEAISDGTLGDAQLLVRCHPHDNIEPYLELKKYARVCVWPENLEESYGVRSTPPANDLLMLAGMMQAADVCVNAASTIVLDAAACDTPILSVGYDGDRKLDYFNSVESYYDYNHQAPYVMSGAGKLCKSRESLIGSIQEVFRNPANQKEERADLAKFATDGTPVNHLVNELSRLIPQYEQLARGA